MFDTFEKFASNRKLPALRRKFKYRVLLYSSTTFKRSPFPEFSSVPGKISTFIRKKKKMFPKDSKYSHESTVVPLEKFWFTHRRWSLGRHISIPVRGATGWAPSLSAKVSSDRSRYLFLGSSPLLPLGHPFVRLPEIPSVNSESRPLTGRRPDGLGPTIYRLDSLVSSVAREREVDALCAAAHGLHARLEGEGRPRAGKRDRERERKREKAGSL